MRTTGTFALRAHEDSLRPTPPELLAPDKRAGHPDNTRMCGRFNLTAFPMAVSDLFGLPDVPDLPVQHCTVAQDSQPSPI
jgi:hypothetical protein